MFKNLTPASLFPKSPIHSSTPRFLTLCCLTVLVSNNAFDLHNNKIKVTTLCYHQCEEVSRLMDQNISSTPGADVTLPGPENPHFFQVARSSHPNPVTQLLQQILTLRDELNHERQQHAAEHKKTRDKYEADLQLLRGVKGNLEKNLKHMEEKYKEDLTCTLKKVEYLEGDWTALQTRASELRSEVDTLGVAVAVRQSLSVVPQQREDTVDQVDERSGSKVPSEWQLERTEFLNRHKALEERLVIQRSESAQVLQETRVGLGSIIVEYNEITKKLVDRKAAVEALQACQEVRSSLNWI